LSAPIIENDDMELVASQNIESFEDTGFLTSLNAAKATERRESLAQDNARLLTVYGDCFEPMVYAHLEEVEVKQ
jgi:hypothetical protein